ncbi:MAG: metallophosphoesterase [Actinomycetota bacterium]
MAVFKAAPDETSQHGTPPAGSPQGRPGQAPGPLVVARSWPWRRWVAWGVEMLVLVFAVSLGGVSATSLFPTTVQTDHYRAEVRLSALPTFRSTIHSPTSFGDLDLEFASPFPSPGIDATVQVRQTITALFDERRVSIESLQPSGHEITSALGAGVTQVGLKFVGGALVVGVGAIILIAYARRRRPTVRQAVSVSLAALLAIGGTGLGMAGTYQPRHLTQFRTTGLLGTVRSNAGLLAGVKARAQEVTPYVTNLLALSAALQAKFVPADIGKPPAARFLLVSDIHGANQYPVMKRIIDDEKITAVIDSGDLINLGRVTEAELSGIFTSIKSLGVPYIFVRGNHDASSLTDQELLQRMKKIPNVVLLEPTAQTYTELGVNGVVLAGFNDPRFFGDDNKNFAQKEQPAAEAFNKAFANRLPPDIVVTHEPTAAKMVSSATLLINGHMHKDELEGNRIGVGTFTGGGTLSHFLVGSGDPSGELAGQPYAFDIAVFGQDCGLTSLTRYTFRNLIEGRPIYDDVRVINGKTIATREPDERICAADLGLSTTTVTVGG